MARPDDVLAELRAFHAEPVALIQEWLNAAGGSATKEATVGEGSLGVSVILGMASRDGLTRQVGHELQSRDLLDTQA